MSWILGGILSQSLIPILPPEKGWVRVLDRKTGYSVSLPKFLAEQEHFDGPMLGGRGGTHLYLEVRDRKVWLTIFAHQQEAHSLRPGEPAPFRRGRLKVSQEVMSTPGPTGHWLFYTIWFVDRGLDWKFQATCNPADAESVQRELLRIAQSLRGSA